MVSVQTGETTAFVNSEPKTLDAAAKIVNDRTFVPLRFVSLCFFIRKVNV